jgi:hypothetical protein
VEVEMVLTDPIVRVRFDTSFLGIITIIALV